MTNQIGPAEKLANVGFKAATGMTPISSRSWSRR